MQRADGLLTTLRTLEPYHFEQLVADLWQECQGWATEVTDASRDHGVDVVGQPPGGGPKTAVQAKRYAEGNKVTSEQIQQYAALRQHYSDIEGVTVVTTSSFTTPARETASRLDVKCLNGEDLVTLIRRDGGVEIVEWYAAGKPEDW
jgi:restriction system protein